MASNEEIIRNLYAVAEKEPKRFRSLFTENGYWWDVAAGGNLAIVSRVRDAAVLGLDTIPCGVVSRSVVSNDATRACQAFLGSKRTSAELPFAHSVAVDAGNAAEMQITNADAVSSLPNATYNA